MKLQPGQARTDGRLHTHSKVANCGDYVSLTARGLDKNLPVFELDGKKLTKQVSILNTLRVSVRDIFIDFLDKLLTWLPLILTCRLKLFSLLFKKGK